MKNLKVPKFEVFNHENIGDDIQYHRAIQISKTLLDLEFISLLEYNKLCELNYKSFSPIFGKIMPNLVDNSEL